MSQDPKISDAEWQVMNLLWQQAPRTSSEVVEALSPRTDWHPKTIKTLLGRLVKKGFATFEDQGGGYLYSPAVAREACVRQESRSFLERVFAGDTPSMLAHFVKTAELSEDDLDELRAILDDRVSDVARTDDGGTA